MKTSSSRKCLAIALVGILAGCSGGGGGGGGSSSSGATTLSGGGQGSVGAQSVQVLTIQAKTTAAADAATFDPTTTLGAGIPGGAVPIAFRQVLAGSGTQGSPSGSLGAQVDEVFGTVSVSEFYLSTYEITQRQWTALATAAGLSGAANLTPWTEIQPPTERAPVDGDDFPAYGISFNTITTLLDAWNGLAGSGPRLRLPTGAEWEHACRAGTTTRYIWGEAETVFPAVQFAVVRETRLADGIVTVGGTRLANAFGFFDMHGNVWEWTSDAPTVQGNVMRGGSWSDNMLSARSANKQHLDPAIGYALSGVRLVLVP